MPQLGSTLKPIAIGPICRMSFEDFLTWNGGDDPERRVEWVNGNVIERPGMSIHENRIKVFLVATLGMLCQIHDLGTLLFEPFILYTGRGGNGRCPDVFLLRNENLERFKDRYVEGPADLVIEVVSESSTKDDYFVKLAEYRRGGVPEYWIIDPIAQQTTFLLLGDDKDYHDAPLDENGLYASPALNGVLIDPKWFQMEEMPKIMGILSGWSLV